MLALSSMDAGLSSTSNPLQQFPFLSTLQVQMRQAAAPLPLHTGRLYPQSMPGTCCQIRQKYPCTFAVQFTHLLASPFKTGIFPGCTCPPGLPVSLEALLHPDQPVKSCAAKAVPAMPVVLIPGSAFPLYSAGDQGQGADEAWWP